MLVRKLQPVWAYKLRRVLVCKLQLVRARRLRQVLARKSQPVRARTLWLVVVGWPAVAARSLSARAVV